MTWMTIDDKLQTGAGKVKRERSQEMAITII
jgi:hypothetical protein